MGDHLFGSTSNSNGMIKLVAGNPWGGTRAKLEIKDFYYKYDYLYYTCDVVSGIDNIAGYTSNCLGITNVETWEENISRLQTHTIIGNNQTFRIEMDKIKSYQKKYLFWVVQNYGASLNIHKVWLEKTGI